MKNVYLILLLMALNAANAEKLIFNNNGEEVDITGDAQINFQTGDISVTTVGDFSIIDANTPVILGFYPSDYDITIGSSITVNWSVAFANTCTASTQQGNTTWSGSKTSDNGSYSQSGVSVTQLPATIRLTCSNNAGSEVKDIVLTEQTGGGGGGSPTINFFRVGGQSNNATVTPPGLATISWDADNVSSCTASATPAVTGWSGTQAASGSRQATFTQDAVVTLTCSTATRNVNVTYNENSSCDSSVYPSGLNRVNSTYAENNDNFNFGESTNATFLLDVGNSQFATLSNFSYPQSNARRRVVFAPAPTNHNLMDVSTISVSECPGDFTNGGATCLFENVHNQSTLFFSTRSSDIGSAFCVLDPAKTYYINYVTSPAPYSISPSCASAGDQVCAFFYSESAL
jgi:hypothetical protein